MIGTGGIAIVSMLFLGSELKSLGIKINKIVEEMPNELLWRLNDNISMYLESYKPSVEKYAHDVSKVLINVLNSFFNDSSRNVFKVMLNEAATLAGSRANGAVGAVFAMYSYFFKTAVLKRPDLAEYLKFGSSVTNEYTKHDEAIRHVFREIA
jgi:hypothetical protein